MAIVYHPIRWAWDAKGKHLLEFDVDQFSAENPDFSGFNRGSFSVLFFDECEADKKKKKSKPIHHYCEHLPHIRRCGAFGVPCGLEFAESKQEGKRVLMGANIYKTSGSSNFFHAPSKKGQHRGDLVSATCPQCQQQRGSLSS